MIHLRGRALGRWDFVILAAFAVLGACLAVATDREYMMTHGRETPRVRDATRLPRRVKERRHDAIRLVNGGSALLAGWGLGLALVVLRPREGLRRPGPFAPGAIAAILTGAFTLAFAIRWEILMAIEPPSPTGLSPPQPSSFPLGVFIGFYTIWGLLRPQVTWLILGAWTTLLATGRWRRPVDGADRLGRCLGAGWLLLGVGQAVIFVIAWC